jgi:hypothetical protein
LETAGQITTTIRAIERNAQRQGALAEIIAELERRAKDILAAIRNPRTIAKTAAIVASPAIKTASVRPS